MFSNRLFKFSTLGSLSQHGTLQKNKEHPTFYSGPFQFIMVSKFHLPQQETYFSKFIDKFLKFEVMGYFIHCVLNRSSLNYSFIFNSATQDLPFPNSSVDSNLGFSSVSLRLYFQVFLNSQRDFGILNVALAGLLSFSQFRKKRCKFAFLNIRLGCTSKLFPIH